MRGVFILAFSILGLVLFSILLFFSDNVSFFWLFLELGTLCLIPSFFLYSSSSTLGGLFNYIVVSSISSSLIICGMLQENLFFLLILGLLIKFGLFPFFGWVYNVCVYSNWFVVWGISTLLKVPIFFFPFFLSAGGLSLVNYLCCLSFLALSLFFWIYSFSWFHCWCHMMLSSSASLVAISLVVSSDVLFYLFFVYCGWSSLVLLFFWVNGGSSSMFFGGPGYYYLFCFLLVSTPASLVIFYKLIMAVSMCSCYYLVLSCWVLYGVSEQFYLLKFVMSCELPKGGLGAVLFV